MNSEILNLFKISRTSLLCALQGEPDYSLWRSQWRRCSCIVFELGLGEQQLANAKFN